MSSVIILRDIINLQNEYKANEDTMTKATLVDIVKPFSEKYMVADDFALQLARNELSLTEVLNFIEKLER